MSMPPNFLETNFYEIFSVYKQNIYFFFCSSEKLPVSKKKTISVYSHLPKISPVTAQFWSLSSSPFAMPAYSFCNKNRIVSYMLFHNRLLLSDVSPSFHVIKDFYLPLIFNILCVWCTLSNPVIFSRILEKNEKTPATKYTDVFLLSKHPP